MYSGNDKLGNFRRRCSTHFLDPPKGVPAFDVDLAKYNRRSRGELIFKFLMALENNISFRVLSSVIKGIFPESDPFQRSRAILQSPQTVARYYKKLELAALEVIRTSLSDAVSVTIGFDGWYKTVERLCWC